jgi:phosphatidate cytidylyltransferase
MLFGIALRLIPHLPRFQSSTSPLSTTTNARFFIVAMQHYQFGLMYLSIGFHFILQISNIGGPIHIGNLLFVVWMSDTGALILGRLMKRKEESKEGNQATANESRNKTGLLFVKSISPGKTLPGLLGAIITGPISSVIYPILLPPSATHHSIEDEQCDGAAASFLAKVVQFPDCFFDHPLSQKAILGLILSLSGIVGDLAESSVKRLSKKKDSGGLLPGHGGVVDRFDSLFVAGVAYYYWVLA